MGIIIFLTGAAGYWTIENLFRGYSHWSMALTGGACLLVFSYYIKAMPHTHILHKAFAGTIIITVFEFFVGLVVNIWYGWQVWDYTNEPGNILGIICPRFTAAWFALSFTVIFVLQKGHWLYERVNAGRKP